MARILVVDDQPELVELLQDVLAADGHAVEAVHGGQAALDRLEQNVYDLVVCDPADAGRRRGRGLSRGRAAGAAAAGHAPHDGLRRCSDLRRLPSDHAGGAVLAKPVGIDKLRERVRRLLEDR